MELKQMPLHELIYQLQEQEEREKHIKQHIRLLRAEVERRYKKGELSTVDNIETKKQGGIF